jgi:hypothetical protein
MFTLGKEIQNKCIHIEKFLSAERIALPHPLYFSISLLA